MSKILNSKTLKSYAPESRNPIHGHEQDEIIVSFCLIHTAMIFLYFLGPLLLLCLDQRTGPCHPEDPAPKIPAQTSWP